MSYHHFTIDERESILIYRTKGLNFSQIRKLLHRHPSNINREWKRHTKGHVENRGEFLFLTPFTKDPKKQTSELGSVMGSRHGCREKR